MATLRVADRVRGLRVRLRHYVERRWFFVGLRGLNPLSRKFGYDRGPQSVGRYYIDNFLDEKRSDVKGRVLEIGEPRYTRRLGSDRVTHSDVLHARPGNPLATIVADLTQADEIPSSTYDCIICTQTLQCIFNVQDAVRHLERILMPGGVLLTTLSGISQISRGDMDRWGEFWRFTTLSAHLLFEPFFPPGGLQIRSYGNVLAATCSLYGLASKELSRAQLDYQDPDYQILITVRAMKPIAGHGGQLHSDEA
jgi:SAM-dependent methyltransferase